MTTFKTLELDINSLKTGDLILMRYEFLPNAIGIRGFINMRQPEHLRCPFNHVAMVIMIGGKPYIAEAKGSGTSKLEAAITRLDGKKIAIRRAKFPINEKDFTDAVISYSSKGVKYDWAGTFWEQLIFQTTGYNKTKSEEEGDEKMYCSEWFARVINILMPYMYNVDGTNDEIPYYLVDPQDLHIDVRYDTLFTGKAKTC